MDWLEETVKKGRRKMEVKVEDLGKVKVKVEELGKVKVKVQDLREGRGTSPQHVSVNGTRPWKLNKFPGLQERAPRKRRCSTNYLHMAEK